MYKILLQRHANKRGTFDEVIEIAGDEVPIFRYAQYSKKPYYFGRLVEIVNGKEEGRASFCNSEYAKP